MSSRMTAMDIEKQEFSRRVRGLDAEEVGLYLKSVASEVERLNLENGKMLEEVGGLKKQVDELAAREATLQQTLVTAQRMSDDIKEQARTERELLIKDARLQADQILRESRNELNHLESEISRARAERENFEQRLRSVIEQHLAMLDMRREARGDVDNLRIMPDRSRSSDAG